MIEHRLVASVRYEHLHGLRMCPRLCRCDCVAASAASLLCTLLGSGLFSAVDVGPTWCGQGLRCSLALDLRASLLVLRSGGLRDCLAARGVSFAGVISLLFSARSGGCGVAGTESSSRLLIEHYGGDTRTQRSCRGGGAGAGAGGQDKRHGSSSEGAVWEARPNGEARALEAEPKVLPRHGEQGPPKSQPLGD
jgi:hypothetical protein